MVGFPRRARLRRARRSARPVVVGAGCAESDEVAADSATPDRAATASLAELSRRAATYVITGEELASASVGEALAAARSRTRIYGVEGGQMVGATVAEGTDLDHDGSPDLALGAPGFDDSRGTGGDYDGLGPSDLVVGAGGGDGGERAVYVLFFDRL